MFAILYVATKSQKFSIIVLSAIFLPGVFVHEMAHLITAELLQVRTHGIEFIPELKDGSLKMGSVQVERSDIFRRLLIGIAPLVVGATALIGILYSFGYFLSFDRVFESAISFLLGFLVVFVVFVIANTMFSSKRDVEGLLEVMLVFAIIIPALYVAGLRPHELLIPFMSQERVVEIVREINILIAFPLAINIILGLVSVPILRKLRFI